MIKEIEVTYRSQKNGEIVDSKAILNLITGEIYGINDFDCTEYNETDLIYYTDNQGNSFEFSVFACSPLPFSMYKYNIDKKDLIKINEFINQNNGMLKIDEAENLLAFMKSEFERHQKEDSLPKKISFEHFLKHSLLSGLLQIARNIEISNKEKTLGIAYMYILNLSVTSFPLEEIFTFIESREHKYEKCDQNFQELAEELIVAVIKKELKATLLMRFLHAGNKALN